MFNLTIFWDADFDGCGRWVAAAPFPFQPRGQRTYRVLRSWS